MSLRLPKKPWELEEVWLSRVSLSGSPGGAVPRREVDSKQLLWEERLWLNRVSCGRGAVWAAPGWASERLQR